MVPMYPMILFGGTGVDVIMQRGQFVVSLENGWIKFLCQSHLIAELLKVSHRASFQLYNQLYNLANVGVYNLMSTLTMMLLVTYSGNEDRIRSPAGREDCLSSARSDEGQERRNHHQDHHQTDHHRVSGSVLFLLKNFCDIIFFYTTEFKMKCLFS